MLGARVTTLPIPDGAYFIRNQTSQKVLELGDNDIVLLRSVAEDNHKWMVTMRGTSVSAGRNRELYSIANVDRLNMRLGYDQPQQDTRIRGKEQLIKWILLPKRNGLFLLTTPDGNFALTTSGPQNKVVLQETLESDEQYWEIFIPTSVNDSRERPIARPVNVGIVTGHKYFIRSWYDGLVLTLGNKQVNASATDEAYVFHQFQTKIDPNSPAGQIWTFNAKPNGKFDIFNTAAIKYLSVASGSESAHTEVLGSADTSSSGWEIRSAGGNAWTICRPDTNLALGFPLVKASNGDKVFLMPNITAQNQIWFFEELAQTPDVNQISRLKVQGYREPRIVGAGTYAIKNVSTGKYLHLHGDSSLWTFHQDGGSGSAAQYRFTIGPLTDEGMFICGNCRLGKDTPYLSKSGGFTATPSICHFIPVPNTIDKYYISLDAYTLPPVVLTATYYASSPTTWDTVAHKPIGEAQQEWQLIRA